MKVRKFDVVYKGIRAPDTMRFKIMKHFDEAIEFIHNGISSGGNKINHKNDVSMLDRANGLCALQELFTSTVTWELADLQCSSSCIS